MIPVHLDRLWGSIFSFERGRFLLEVAQTDSLSGDGFVRQLRCRHPRRAHEVRQAIQELASDAADVFARARAICWTCASSARAQKNWRQFAMADSSGRELTYGRALTGSLLVADWVRKNRRDGRNDRRAAAVLSRRGAGERRRHDGGQGPGESELHGRPRSHGFGACEQCGIRTILTSKSVSGESQDRSAWTAWFSWKTFWAQMSELRQSCARCWPRGCCRRACSPPAGNAPAIRWPP